MSSLTTKSDVQYSSNTYTLGATDGPLLSLTLDGNIVDLSKIHFLFDVQWGGRNLPLHLPSAPETVGA